MGCNAPQWRSDDAIHGLRWRDRTAFVCGSDVVLAWDESSASEVAETANQLRAALATEHLPNLGPTLWIVMGPNERTLAADAASLSAVLGQPTEPNHQRERRHRRDVFAGGIGAKAHGREVRTPTPAEQEHIAALLLRTLTAPVRLDAQQLNLPHALITRVQQAIVYPSDAGLRAVADAVLDRALELQDLSIWETALFSMARGAASSAIGDKLAQARQKVIYEWLAEDLGWGESQALARALGVKEAAQVEDAAPLTMEQFLAAPTTCFPADTHAPAIDWSKFTEVAFDDRIETEVKVVAHGFFDELGGAVPGKLLLMRKGAIQREHLDALFDRIGNTSDRLLFRAATKELAAAVATLHAVERRGFTQQQALQLWTEFAMPAVVAVNYETLRPFLDG